MSVHDSQDEAVQAAMIDAAAEGCERVHVYGSPEKRLATDARLCTEPDLGQVVVYHVEPVAFEYWWICDKCGMTDGPEC